MRTCWSKVALVDVTNMQHSAAEDVTLLNAILMTHGSCCIHCACQLYQTVWQERIRALVAAGVQASQLYITWHWQRLLVV
jgi:hypothetical protein